MNYQFATHTPQGFEVGLQEQEASYSDHLSESVGWVAIGTGQWTNADGRTLEISQVENNWNPKPFEFGNALDVKNPAIIGNINSIQGTDTCYAGFMNLSSTQMEIYVAEEQSRDEELMHHPESISVFVAQ